MQAKIEELWRRFRAEPRPSGATLELEARIKHAFTEAEFAVLTSTLQHNKAWDSASPTPVFTKDQTFPGEVRVSFGGEGRIVECVRKQPLARILLGATDCAGSSVRLSVATEEPCDPPPTGALPRWTRMKERMSFVYENVRYDLTRVTEGADAADPTSWRTSLELELEWCGAPTADPATVAASMAPKVLNMAMLVASGPFRASVSEYEWRCSRKPRLPPSIPGAPAAGAGASAAGSRAVDAVAHLPTSTISPTCGRGGTFPLLGAAGAAGLSLPPVDAGMSGGDASGGECADSETSDGEDESSESESEREVCRKRKKTARKASRFQTESAASPIGCGGKHKRRGAGRVTLWPTGRRNKQLANIQGAAHAMLKFGRGKDSEPTIAALRVTSAAEVLLEDRPGKKSILLVVGEKMDAACSICREAVDKMPALRVGSPEWS